MGNLNKVVLIGRLGQDPEKKLLPSGDKVVNVSFATSEKFNDRAGVKQERTEWHNVVLWNDLADLAERYLRQGSQCYVEGSLRTREWLDDKGNKRWSTEIHARTIQFLDSPYQDSSGFSTDPQPAKEEIQGQKSQIITTDKSNNFINNDNF